MKEKGTKSLIKRFYEIIIFRWFYWYLIKQSNAPGLEIISTDAWDIDSTLKVVIDGQGPACASFNPIKLLWHKELRQVWR